MLIDYAVVADASDNKIITKQGCIKLVDIKNESEVISERVTRKTETNKVEIVQK